MKLIDKVSAELEAAAFTKSQIAAVERAIANNVPPKTYVVAAYFLGAITAALVLGALVLAGIDRSTDAIWVAVGAGIGGLAGIFAPRE